MSLFWIRVIVVIIAMLFGAYLALRPRQVIEMQIALYRPFNWKIEPISMEKEIKNTRIMGAAVIILGIIAFVYIIMQ
ncbi:MAG: hypothetical protein JSV30_00075 [Candidatus Omnitrophota bacterium]|nr:MAG: hypothetical protein JSV30_00075 [Candidatus Omnitrophota bacterium]